MSEIISPKTFLGNLLSVRAHAIGLRVKVVDGELRGVHFTRYEITEDSPKERFCLSMLLLPDGLVGRWTRDMVILPRFPEPDYRFDPTTCEQWLDGWFGKTVQEQLAPH